MLDASNLPQIKRNYWIGLSKQGPCKWVFFLFFIFYFLFFFIYLFFFFFCGVPYLCAGHRVPYVAPVKVPNPVNVNGLLYALGIFLI